MTAKPSRTAKPATSSAATRLTASEISALREDKRQGLARIRAYREARRLAKATKPAEL